MPVTPLENGAFFAAACFALSALNCLALPSLDANLDSRRDWYALMLNRENALCQFAFFLGLAIQTVTAASAVVTRHPFAWWLLGVLGLALLVSGLVARRNARYISRSTRREQFKTAERLAGCYAKAALVASPFIVLAAAGIYLLR